MVKAAGFDPVIRRFESSRPSQNTEAIYVMQNRKVSVSRLMVFSGNANKELAKEVGKSLGVAISKAVVSLFSDGEINVEICENVRGQDVFVVQPTCSPTNRHVMELVLMIDALRRASAGRITAVVPYFGYARQDRKDEPRVPISARVLLDLMNVVGINRIMAMDLHSPQIQGFINLSLIHI